LDWLGDMFGADRGRLAEIGDGAGDFQDSIVRAGGEAHAADGHFESALAGIVEGADFADGAGGHPGVVESASLLQGAGALDAGANLFGGFGGGVAAQFLEGHGGDFDVNIDAVEQGPADLAEIPLDLAGRAAAFTGGIAIEAAAAGVHITTEHLL